MKKLPLVALMLLLLSSCMGLGDYQASEQGVASIDPRKIEVDSSLYPIYSVKTSFVPPRSFKLPTKEEYFKKRGAERVGWDPHFSLPRVEDTLAWRAIDTRGYNDLVSRSQWTKIIPSDIWRVTHVYKGLYLIHSETYQQRECTRLLSFKFSGAQKTKEGCSLTGRIHIYIKPDGKVYGGWKHLNRDSLLSSRRRTPMEPDNSLDDEWRKTPSFVINQKP